MKIGKSLLAKLLFMCTLIYFFGCSKKEVTPSNPSANGSGVYIAGTVTTAAGIPVAMYWKNDSSGSVTLSDGTSYAVARSIAVPASGDVYVAGTTVSSQGHYVATYWKITSTGQEVVPLSDGSTDAEANAIVVTSSGDVFVAGYVSLFNSSNRLIYYPTYWLNGAIVTLGTTGYSDAKAYSIAISNSGDIYVAGYTVDNTGTFATYWKNGVGVQLSDGTPQAKAISIAISGSGDVYVAGYADNIGTYWKNGVAVLLGSGTSNLAYPTSVALSSSGDVYIAGAKSSPTGVNTILYWKNGSIIPLSDSTAREQAVVNSIALSSSGDIYVAGGVNSKTTGNYEATFWKNGTATTGATTLSNGKTLGNSYGVAVR